jgi:hypothetical protein
MSHTPARLSFHVRVALLVGLTASSLAVGTSSADVIRDQWYLDATAPSVATTLAVQARDTWYLEETAPALLLARSYRAQQDA